MQAEGKEAAIPVLPSKGTPSWGCKKGVQGAKTFPGSTVTPRPHTLACVCVSPPALQGQPSHSSYSQLTFTKPEHFVDSQVRFSFSK